MSDAEGASGLRLTEEERRQLAATISQNLGYAVNAIICENIARQVDAILADRLAAHPPEPEASAPVCPTCKAVDNEYCSNPWHLSPTQPAPSDLAAILVREIHCTWCDAEPGEPCREWGDHVDHLHDARSNEAQRLAQVVADTYLPAVVREAEARAWDEGYEAGYRLQQGRPVDRPRRGGL